MSRVRETGKPGTLFLKEKKAINQKNNSSYHWCQKVTPPVALPLSVELQNDGNESETRQSKQNNFHRCPGASKAVGKEEEKESNASRTLNANLGEKQARERRGFQRLLCFQLSPAESVGSRRKGSWVLSALWP